MTGQSIPARSAGIDLLRGISVLLVVLHHTQLRLHIEDSALGALLPHWAIRSLFWSGYYSVITFFVISGFLITSLSLRRWGSLPAIRPLAFYRLRAARILPLLVALVAVLSVLHLAGVEGYQIRPERASLARTVLAALTFHVNYLEGHHGYLPGNWDVLWSLSIEEAFYLAFPLVCLALRSRGALGALLLALVVAGPVSRTLLGDALEPWDDYAWLSGMDAIALGCAAAGVAERCRASPRVLRLLLALGVAAVMLVVVARETARGLGLADLGLTVTVLALGVALILVAMHGGVGQAAAQRWGAPLRLLGRLSYEVYLTHMFVVLTLVRVTRQLALPADLVPLWDVLAVGLSAALGYVVARYISEPANRALRAGLPRGP